MKGEGKVLAGSFLVGEIADADVWCRARPLFAAASTKMRSKLKGVSQQLSGFAAPLMLLCVAEPAVSLQTQTLLQGDARAGQAKSGNGPEGAVAPAQAGYSMAGIP